MVHFDCIIYSQLLNAMNISVQTVISNTDNVKELWDALADIYSSLNDVVCGLLKLARAGRTPLPGFQQGAYQWWDLATR